jgi:hypothetical protein
MFSYYSSLPRSWDVTGTPRRLECLLFRDLLEYVTSPSRVPASTTRLQSILLPVTAGAIASRRQLLGQSLLKYPAHAARRRSWWELLGDLRGATTVDADIGNAVGCHKLMPLERLTY